jgi:hypothetical protein
MDLPGEAYLFNLSLLAITFAAVSALVMLLRQTMGGKLSNFDLHLITSYISGGFALTLGAVMPPLVSLGAPAPAVLWGVSSALAALFLASFLVSMIRRRRKASGAAAPPMVVLDWTSHGIAIVLLAANAVVPALQGVIVFAVALTLSLGFVMFGFVRRIASLLGDRPGDDWNPRRG